MPSLRSKWAKLRKPLKVGLLLVAVYLFPARRSDFWESTRSWQTRDWGWLADLGFASAVVALVLLAWVALDRPGLRRKRRVQAHATSTLPNIAAAATMGLKARQAREAYERESQASDYLPKPADVQESAQGVTIAVAEAKQAEAEASAKRYGQQESAGLLTLADKLENEMWELRLSIKRSSPSLPLDVLPGEFLDRAHDFNKRVFQLAQTHLTAREASDVALFPTLLGAMTNATHLEPMFTANRQTLRLIQQRSS
jgi:hypothetical protein